MEYRNEEPERCQRCGNNTHQPTSSGNQLVCPACFKRSEDAIMGDPNWREKIRLQMERERAARGK